MPLYCVALYKHFTKLVTDEFKTQEIRDFMQGKQVCLVQKSLKTINAELPTILSKKGCDASNAWDEEGDKEFSDDEQE